MGVPRRALRRACGPARTPSPRRAPEDASSELPVLRRRPALLLAAQDRRRDRHPHPRLDSPLRHPDRTWRRTARSPAVRRHLAPGLPLSPRAARHAARLASSRRRPRHQLVRVAVDLAEERQAQPCSARGDGAIAGAVLLRESGRCAEQRKEHSRVRRRYVRIPHRRHDRGPGAALARSDAGARRGLGSRRRRGCGSPGSGAVHARSGTELRGSNGDRLRPDGDRGDSRCDRDRTPAPRSPAREAAAATSSA